MHMPFAGAKGGRGKKATTRSSGYSDFSAQSPIEQRTTAIEDAERNRRPGQRLPSDPRPSILSSFFKW